MLLIVKAAVIVFGVFSILYVCAIYLYQDQPSNLTIIGIAFSIGFVGLAYKLFKYLKDNDV